LFFSLSLDPWSLNATINLPAEQQVECILEDDFGEVSLILTHFIPKAVLDPVSLFIIKKIVPFSVY